MVSLYLCKTNSKDPRKEYALMVRDYNGTEVDWTTLCYMDDYSAYQLDHETVSIYDGDFEEKPEVKALRLEHPSLREAWENYQTLKALFTKK